MDGFDRFIIGMMLLFILAMGYTNNTELVAIKKQLQSIEMVLKETRK